MSTVETKGRRMLAGMFGGEQVVFGNEMLETFEVEDPQKLEQEIKQLPNEIVLYLQSLAPRLPEYVSELISELLESLDEKEASRRLWERFGVPKSVLAVPVFKQLSENLGEAQEGVTEKSEELQTLTRKLTDVIEKVSLFYAERLNRLEEEDQENANALLELNTIDTRGSTMLKTTSESALIFEKRQTELAREKAEMKMSQASWLQRAKGWLERLPLIQSFETPIDLAQPSQAMAL